MSSGVRVGPARELAAIEELHRRDMDAAKAGDAEALAALWSDDIVSLPPGGRITRGRDAAYAGLVRALERARDLETTEYVLEFEEVCVLGEYAFEWGEVRGAVRPRGGGEEIRSQGKVLRILRKGSDGGWRVHRTMWSMESG
jgi:uncharacterized protein (TIGR02246 family)